MKDALGKKCKKTQVGLQVGQALCCECNNYVGEAPVPFVTSQGADFDILKECRLLLLCGISSSMEPGQAAKQRLPSVKALKNKNVVSHLNKLQMTTVSQPFPH